MSPTLGTSPLSRPNHMRLAGEDLTFWWLDSPQQPTTMAMLMVLDRPPEPLQLRRACERAVAAVPRLAQRVVEAPLGITLPHWESDPTFDLDYHVRRHALSGPGDLDELFREIGPAYETPFDRSRPLWEARIYDGLRPGRRSAIFFKIHHAIADGIGANAIFAALTDGERAAPNGAPACDSPMPASHGAWPEQMGLGMRVVDALRDRVELDLDRAGAAAHAVREVFDHPENVRKAFDAVRSIVDVAGFDSHSPLKHYASRSRRLSGFELPLDELRAIKRRLDGCMIDVILTIMARAIGKWYAAHRLGRISELMTLVPINLRKPEEWGENARVGNVASGILVPLPIRLPGARATYREIRNRMAARKADPASTASPLLADLLSVLPRPVVTWLAETTFGSIDFIVTNVPGIPVPRYLASAEILAAYPFAPVALRSPVSVALYGYCDRLFVGLDSDQALMPDTEIFQRMILDAFEELRTAARPRRTRGVRRPARRRMERKRA